MNNTLAIIIILVVIIGGAYLLVALLGPGGEVETSDNQEQEQEQGQEQEQELEIEVLQEGTGPAAKSGDTLTVHYTGTFLDGTKFDSSVDRDTPFGFVLGQGMVIQGWDLGLLGAKAGEKRKLTIPAHLAYGSSGTPSGSIPPNSTLIFEVEVLSINE